MTELVPQPGTGASIPTLPRTLRPNWAVGALASGMVSTVNLTESRGQAYFRGWSGKTHPLWVAPFLGWDLGLKWRKGTESHDAFMALCFLTGSDVAAAVLMFLDAVCWAKKTPLP